MWYAFDTPNVDDFADAKDWREMTTEERKISNDKYSAHSLSNRDISRTDPHLVQLVEELGDKENKMKPFNLQEALAGKPVVTRDGRKVQDIRHLPSAKPYSVVGVVDDGISDNPSTYTRDGVFSIHELDGSAADLFMASQKREGWINIYSQEPQSTESGAIYKNIVPVQGSRIIHPSKNSADYCPTLYLGKRIACVRIEWEE